MKYQPSLFGIPENAKINLEHYNKRDFQVLAWNMQSPSLDRAESQWQYLKSSKANVFVLSELKNNDGLLFIIDMFQGNGFNIARNVPASGDGYITLIACHGIEMQKPKILNPQFGGERIVITSLKNDLSKELLILGLYAPTCGGKFATEKQDKKKEAFHAELHSYLTNNKKAGNIPWIIAGDLNSLEPNHIPSSAYFKKWDYTYNFFMQNGMKDAFRLVAPDKLEYSWMSSQNEGQRLDHIFIDNELLPSFSGCSYDHTPRYQQLSDHSAIKMKISG